jgi:hypothetical protein
METKRPDSKDILRLIDELSLESPYSDEESRAALEEAGVDPERLSKAVRRNIRHVPGPRKLRDPWEALRSCALVVAATALLLFVAVFHVNYRASVEAQRQLARAQLIGPLLPVLASDDSEKRAIALVVAQQVDPAFASQTQKQLAQWEISSQTDTRNVLSRNPAYSGRIIAGLQKLQFSRDPDDRKLAIWNDLLPVLNEARKNRDEFVDVAIEYRRVIPFLRVRNPEVFLDSYWGELWILNILLESKIVPVVQAARQQAPEPAVVEQIFRQHAPKLPDKDRRAFEEALSVYENTLKTIQ